MVALKNIESVSSLLDLACRVARGMEAELIALHVVEMPDALDLSAEAAVLDQPGKEVLARLMKLPARSMGRFRCNSFVPETQQKPS